MWSRKRIPVETSYFPRPSMVRAIRISVSAVLRCSLALLMPAPQLVAGLAALLVIQAAQPLHATRGRASPSVRSIQRLFGRSLHSQDRSAGPAPEFRAGAGLE